MKTPTKKLLLILIAFISFNTTLFAQLEEAIEVETSLKKVSTNEYDIIFEYFIEEGWHLYSQYNPKGASEALKITATDENQTDFEIIGKAKESKTHKKYNEMFEMEEIFFEGEAILKQRIKIKNKKLKFINVSISGQACEVSCLPYRKEFKIKFKKKKRRKKKKKKKKIFQFLKKNNLIIIISGVGSLLLILILVFILRKKK